jgi:hypothetical protein
MCPEIFLHDNVTSLATQAEEPFLWGAPCPTLLHVIRITIDYLLVILSRKNDIP